MTDVEAVDRAIKRLEGTIVDLEKFDAERMVNLEADGFDEVKAALSEAIEDDRQAVYALRDLMQKLQKQP